jgi:hypothetical protein
MATPRVTVVTGSEAAICPAGTTTVPGTVRMPFGVAVTATAASAACTAESVTVKVLVVPTANGNFGGSNDTRTGCAGEIVTRLVAVEPWSEAATCAVPGELPETSI